MATSVLSRNIITQIFGTDFASSLDAYNGSSAESVGGSTTGESSKGGTTLTPVSLIGVGSQTTQQDGPRPTKSPRTELENDELGLGKKKIELSVDGFGQVVQRRLEQAMEESKRKQKVVSQEGRLGPNIVKYDVGSHVGSFVISNDRLGVNSQCNFGSVKASTCVYKGKWQYEVQLGSKGVMQLGWATLETKFSQEKGVGDTADSYAYDGNRLRKWNRTTTPYGETWQAGDIIGCCIDLDEGKIEFFRNGRSLGVAFSNIRRGPGIAYFPAASLAYGENIVSNFGATPFQYLVEGFSPLQLQTSSDNAKTDLLLQWLNKVLSMYPGGKFYSDNYSSGGGSTKTPAEYQSLLVITNRLMEFLGPYLHSGFVVEQSFFPFFASCLGLPPKITHTDVISTSSDALNYNKTELLLDVMWTFLEETEMKTCLERLCIILMNQFRSNSLSLHYPFQHYGLHCLLALTQHRLTRRHMIRHLLFDKTKLMHFFHIRPMDESVLKEVITQTWWPGKSPEDSSEALAYERSVQLIQNSVTDLQALQVRLLKQLLTNTDGTEKRPSSRALFLKKFRYFVRDVVRPGSVLHQPVNKAMATFFCFLRTITELYSEEVERTTEPQFPDLPSSMFYDTSVTYFEMERIGGIASYLYKAHHKEVSQALSIPDYISTVSPPPPPPAAGATVVAPVTIRRDVVHRDTPIPSLDHLQVPPPPEMTDGGNNAPAPPAPITISVPRIQPQSTTPAATGGGGGGGNAAGILQTGTATTATTQTSTTPGGRAAVTITPHAHHPHMRPQPAATSPPLDREENASISATSSGEEIPSPIPVPHFGAALLAGTPSGHNMLIPMLTDFRNFIAQGEHGFTYFPGGFLGFPGLDHRNAVQPHNPAVALLGKESGAMDVRASLRELLDDAIIVYSSGVQRHMEKVVSLRTTMDDYIKALDRANENLKNPFISESERVELRRSAEIFAEKLDEQARHVAWIKSVVFTKERQLLVHRLLKTVLQTLKASSGEGPLFTFVPEHFISTVVNLTWCLLTQMHPTVPYSSLEGLNQVLTDVAEFVATHFADSRIVIAETKDTLTQALSSFICNSTMLNALERMPQSSQVSMVKAILRPYENRAWAQSNWMLVRFWQGSGYGFQYPNPLEARRSFRAKPVQDEFGISTNLPPTPSHILQGHVANVLLENQKFAVSYVHSVLNQLNWAFSEFVGLLQEIQNAANRPERVFIESRQLKICCTCFELTQALLRVMEMVSSIASPVMKDSTRESAEPLLTRLCMLLSQIMNRIGSNIGCFAQVMELDIPGLENVTHYPLLSAVGGILVALIGQEVEKTEDGDMIATKALLSEPSFQITSLNFFFGRDQPSVPEGRRIFNLRNHVPDDVSQAEITALENVVAHLKQWAERMQTEMDALDDDEICTICYAYPKNTTFKPCNHRACKACILHHLMNRGECFFCKATIQQVFMDDGTKIHDINVANTSKKNEEHGGRRAL